MQHTQNFRLCDIKRNIASWSHAQNAWETRGKSYRFPFGTKIRGVLAVQIGASLPAAPSWAFMSWCLLQAGFCSQKFTGLSLSLIFKLLWIRNITCFFLFNVSKKNTWSNKQPPWCSVRTADFSTLHKTTHQTLTSESFFPTVLGSFTNGGNWQGGGGTSRVFPPCFSAENGSIYRISLSTQASFNFTFVILSGSMKIGSSGMSKNWHGGLFCISNVCKYFKSWYLGDLQAVLTLDTINLRLLNMAATFRQIGLCTVQLLGIS